MSRRTIFFNIMGIQFLFYLSKVEKSYYKAVVVIALSVPSTGWINIKEGKKGVFRLHVNSPDI